jgi:hypothetical protein
MFAEKQARNQWFPIALILRTAGGGVPKDEGGSSAVWILLRDACCAGSSG